MPNKKFFLPIVALFSVAALASCGPNEPEHDPEIQKIYNAYRANAEDKGEAVLSYEEWLASIKGEKGEPGAQGPQGPKGDKGDQGDQGPAGKDGQDGKDGEDGQDGQNGKDGQNGQNGKDGENGHDGKDGEDGKDGQDGEDGEDGKSAFEIYCAAHPEYEGDEVQWMDDLVNGRLGNHEKVSVMYLTGFYDPDFNPDITDDVEPSCVKVEGAVDLEDEKGFKLELEAGKLAGRPGDPSIVGYDFEGWYSLGFKADGSAFYEPFNFSQTPVSGDMILIAKYSAKSFDIEIICGDDESYHVSLKHNEIPASKLPDEVKAPHGTKVFAGLFADDKFKYPVDLNEPYKMACDYTVFAKYDDYAEDGAFVSAYSYDGDYNPYMFKFIKSGTNVDLFNLVSESAYGSYEFVKFDEFNNLVFSKADSSESIIVTSKNGSFSFVVTEPKNGADYYVKVFGENLMYPGDFYGSKFDRESAMIEVTGKYVANTSLAADASEYSFFPGDSIEDNLFEHISFDEEASVKSYKLEVVEGSEDFFELDYYGYHVLTSKIGDASIVLRDYDENTLPLTIHNVEKTYISAIEITGEGIQDDEVTLELGQTLQLGASYSMDGVNQQPIIKWSSNKTSVASVNSSSGLVTAKAVGSATITVKDDAKPAPKVQKTLTVNVVLPAIPEKMIGPFSCIGHDDWGGCDMPVTIDVSESGAKAVCIASDGTYPYDVVLKSVSDGVYSFEGEGYYALKMSLKVDGDDVVLVSMSGGYFDDYWSIESNIVLTRVQKHDLSIDSSIENGSITMMSPEVVGQVPAGSQVVFYPEAASGYALKSVSVNGGAVATNKQYDYSIYDYVYTFVMPEEAAEISAEFEQLHSVSKVSDLTGGKIVLGSSDEMYQAGDEVSFSIKPDEGYNIKSVFIVDHPEVVVSVKSSTNPFSGVTTYTGSFVMPDFDVVVSAEFESDAPVASWPSEKIKSYCNGDSLPAPSQFENAEITQDDGEKLVISVSGCNFETYCGQLSESGLASYGSGDKIDFYNTTFSIYLTIEKVSDTSFTLSIDMAIM